MSKKLTKKQNGKVRNVRFLCIFMEWGAFFLFLLFHSWAMAQEKELPAIHLPSTTENSQNIKNTQVALSGSQGKGQIKAQGESHGSATSESTLPPYYAVPVETASFNGIVPGQTQVAQLRKDFGNPANTQINGAGKGIDVEEYKIEGFKAVAFHVMNKTVMAVIAELEESVNARDLATGLGMSHIQSVFITDEKGTIKGEIYPEIGVAFAYDPNKPLGNVADMAKNPTGVPMNALQILFQPVGPEPFLLRAETWVDIDPKRSYRDILQALKMDPKNEQALTYQKILTEAVPELKRMTLEELSPQMPEMQEAQETQEAPEAQETQKRTSEVAEKGEISEKEKVSENKETADPSEKVETQKDTEIAGEKAENAQVVQKEAKLEMTSEAEAEVTPEVKPSEKTDVVATLPRAELISESETQEVLEAVELPDLPSVPGEGVGENTGGNAGESAENVTDSSDSLMELTPPSLDSLTDTGEGGGVAETVESTPKLPETASKLPEATEELPEATEELPEATEELPEAAEELPEIEGKTSASAPELPQTAEELSEIAPELPEVEEGQETDSGKDVTGKELSEKESSGKEGTEAQELPTSLDSLPEIPGGMRVPTDEEVLNDGEVDNTPSSGSLRLLPSEEAEKTALELPTELEAELDTLEEMPETEKEPEPRELELSFENELFENVEYLARNDRIPQALELLDEMRKKFLDNPFVSFRVNIVEGDILMILPEPDVQQAFRSHRRAAEQGEKLLDGGKVVRGRRYPLTTSEKQAVQELLLDAWLGVASDLASGDWDQKVNNCQKWLQKAKKQIDLLVPPTKKETTREMVALRYRTAYRTLSIALLLGEEVDITDDASRLISAGQEQLRVAESPQHYFDVCLETALLLDDAGTVSILRSEDVAAQRYLTRAIALMERVKEGYEKKNKKLNTKERFLLSQLYYHMGQVLAWRANRLMAESPENIETVNQKRLKLHEQAIVWYGKSTPLLMEVIRTKEWKDLLQLSRIMNGMSVSYMEMSDTKRALVLLKTGIFCLEQHVADHPEDKYQLVVPYRNIIRVLAYQGEREEQEKYQKKLDSLGI